MRELRSWDVRGDCYNNKTPLRRPTRRILTVVPGVNVPVTEVDHVYFGTRALGELGRLSVRGFGNDPDAGNIGDASVGS